MRYQRYRAWTLCAILTVTGCAMEPHSEDDQRRSEVFAARDAVWRAWFSNDVAVLERMLPPEFVGIGFGGGAMDTRESTLRASSEFATSGGALRRLAFSDDRLQTFGDVVTVFSNYEIDLDTAGERLVQRGRATEVFVKRNGTWTNPAWHLDSGR